MNARTNGRAGVAVLTLALGLMFGAVVHAATAERAATASTRTAATGTGAAMPVATASPTQVYADECGACHVAYPARLLRSPDWSAILGNLDRHYGTDAALDAPALARVATALGVAAPGAGAARTPADALPRITRQPWFVREHDAGRLARHGRTAERLSQCDACHAGAVQGRFEDDEHERGRADGDRRIRTREREEHHR